jgi:hypothetical protein
MTEDVSTRTTRRVEPAVQRREEGLERTETDAVRSAADRVTPAQVNARLGDRDDFDRTEGGMKAEAATTGPDPNVQPAGLSVPIGLLTSTGSPISSEGAVRRMGELGALGDGTAARFNRAQYQDLINPNPGAPFTGSGATGDNPLRGSIPVGDMAALARYHQGERDLTMLRQRRDELERTMFTRPPGIPDQIEERRQQFVRNQLEQNEGHIRMTRNVMDHLQPTVDSYRNPLSENPAVSGDPKDHFDERTRERQAELMFNQPISTIHGNAYGDRIPSRADVVSAAARRYNLDPNVLGGVLLQEQRDQSRKEDTADIGGATLAGRDTSIGLGQILMSTAVKNNADLLSDTVDPQTRANLTRNDVARLLTSDEHNIYATARYLRQTADRGATIGADPAALPTTRRDFPGFDPASLRGSNWNGDTVRAIASEYTSRPWDDRTVTPDGYPQHVLDAVNDIRRARIFR